MKKTYLVLLVLLLTVFFYQCTRMARAKDYFVQSICFES